MKWPQIPTSLAGLSGADIRALARSITVALREAPLVRDADEQAEWEKYAALASDIDAQASQKLAEEAQDAAEAARAAAAAATEAAADPEESEEADEDEDEEQAEPELATVGAPTNPTLSVATTAEVVAVNQSRWQATGAVSGVKKGDAFSDDLSLAAAISDAAAAMQAGASSRVEVATMSANFGERTDYVLSEDVYENMGRFDRLRRDSKALSAAFCASATPLYDLACDSTDRRPVRASLPVFQTPTRGAFSVFPSPTLADVSSGWGQWTSEDDADPEAIKEACATITCGTPTEYEIYGVYACLKVRNLVQMTFPELVAAFMNRLMAQRARFAETLLLEAMGSNVDEINAPNYGYGANVELKRIILQYLAHYQELERWDIDTADAWMPRWLLWALKIDAISRRTTDGSYPTVPSTSTIEQSFRDIGIEPHWYIDRPTWATPVNPLAVGGNLTFLPSSVEILVARRGKFALLDRGNLTIGVAPNNIYRLEDDLMRNQYTFFTESFEGIIDTDSCPAHLINIPNLCYTGQQISDRPIDCEGEPGRIGS